MIDLFGDDADAEKLLIRALSIIDEDVHVRCKEFFAIRRYAPGSELMRLHTALGEGPLSITDAIGVGLNNAWGALGHLSHIIHNPVPTSRVVLQSLMRAVLVGSARTLYVFLPTTPEDREQRARAVLAKDCDSGHQALQAYATFQGLGAFAAPEELRDQLKAQRKTLWPSGNPPGDGKVITGMIDSLGIALKTAGNEVGAEQDILQDHGAWLWNTYSGLAHGYTWPRLLPGISPDRGIPGDFPMDIYQVAVVTHIAALAALNRSLPGSATTTDPVPGTWD